MTAEGRRDFRGKIVITIDGEDSRDFDDAVSLERAGGNFLLGVHIADVSRYVKRGGALDNEAYARGTSVYFPDRVLPMLPEELSNGACSLNEGEDRYALSCFMEVNGRGEVVRSELCESVIRSRNRMTYTKVAAILAGDAETVAEYADIVPLCTDMAKLSRILEEARAKRGGIDLDVREAHISREGEEVKVEARERNAAHRLIEAFMILANETVARFLEGKGLPCLFRVHEKPSEEKASAFAAYLRGLGVPVRFSAENVRPSDYAEVLSSAEGSGARTVVNRVMLRSMMKARYCEENFGHFGLASKCYCHFTSPIRRYPDLVVHRVVKAALHGREEEAEKFASFVKSAGLRCSETERRAEEAERDVDDLYKTWYMRSHIGEAFPACVSGFSGAGMFVELENTVEGLLPSEGLPPTITSSTRSAASCAAPAAAGMRSGINSPSSASAATSGSAAFPSSRRASFPACAAVPPRRDPLRRQRAKRAGRSPAESAKGKGQASRKGREGKTPPQKVNGGCLWTLNLPYGGKISCLPLRRARRMCASRSTCATVSRIPIPPKMRARSSLSRKGKGKRATFTAPSSRRGKPWAASPSPAGRTFIAAARRSAIGSRPHIGAGAS